MSSISLRFHETLVAIDDEEKKISEGLTDYKLRLAMYSCTIISPWIRPQIRYSYPSEKITEDGEKCSWGTSDQRFFVDPNALADSHHNENENEDDEDIGDENEDAIVHDMIIDEMEDEYQDDSFYIYYHLQKFDWSHTRIVKTATNSLNFLALTDDGKLYYKNISGENALQCMYQMDIKEKLIYFACGYNFHVVATDNGKVYTWGANFDGHSGISTCTIERIEACEAVELPGKTIVEVVCGDNHTLVLTDKGKVYSCKNLYLEWKLWTIGS